ncbi:MAG TPA: FMN-binding protein, partial [Saprospiraceae bacterium]|nr:FMN-binding protein [Saprospiraceae bacterium]
MSTLLVASSNVQSSERSMLVAMASIGIICALLIVITYEGTASTIEKNKIEALDKAIFKVIPNISTTMPFQFNVDQTFSLATSNISKNPKVYAGYDKNGTLKGIAITAVGKGYGEVLNLLYGYDPVQQKIIGFYVLESKETPGIGDKIEKMPFLNNFNAMEVTLTEDQSKLLNNITTVKQGAKSQSWEIDAITGATITSRAVGNILNVSAQ